MKKRTKSQLNREYKQRPYAKARIRVKDAEHLAQRRVLRRQWYARNRERIRKYQHEYYYGTEARSKKWLKYFRDYYKKQREATAQVEPTEEPKVSD